MQKEETETQFFNWAAQSRHAQFIKCVFSSLRSRRLEVVGTRKNGRARRRHARGEEAPSPLACLPRARPFSLSPATSKRLLRRLRFFLRRNMNTCNYGINPEGVAGSIKHVCPSSQSLLKAFKDDFFLFNAAYAFLEV